MANKKSSKRVEKIVIKEAKKLVKKVISKQKGKREAPRKGMKKGKPHKGQRRHRQKDAEALNRELDQYWMKSGDKKVVTSHLDDELSAYMKKSETTVDSKEAKKATL